MKGSWWLWAAMRATQVCWSSAPASASAAGEREREIFRYQFQSWFVRSEKVATSEMFERETRREKILEAIDLNREMQLRQKNKDGFLNLLAGKKQKYSLGDNKESKEENIKVDPLVEAEKEFYRILNEVKKITFEEN